MISYFTSHFLLIVLQELYEMRCRLDEADRTILLAEERLHEHNIIDENLSAMLAKVKMHSEAELRRFKEESEISYQNGVSYHIFASAQYQPLLEESIQALPYLTKSSRLAENQSLLLIVISVCFPNWDYTPLCNNNG